MMQDTVRTGAYQAAILSNASDFAGKVVMDVGTGSGILAYFAVKAGARKVYAIEASNVADRAARLLAANGLSDRITVIKSKVEEVVLPEGEKVDLIISEPMGFMLIHERMLESYIIARQMFLKPGGRMFPTTGTIFAAPFTDASEWPRSCHSDRCERACAGFSCASAGICLTEPRAVSSAHAWPTLVVQMSLGVPAIAALWQEQINKVAFWYNTDFYGLDISCLADAAASDHFAQPVVGYVEPSCLLSEGTATRVIDFEKDEPESLHSIDLPFEFAVSRTAICHGLAVWFDVSFDGSTVKHVLSTAPSSPGTHWYQCRLLLKDPIAVNAKQRVVGNLHMAANTRYSYNLTLTMKLGGSEAATTDGSAIESTVHVNLQDQMYHYLSAPTAAT
jgi:histone-arginine methyltransferase CARM1